MLVKIAVKAVITHMREMLKFLICVQYVLQVMRLFSQPNIFMCV